MAVPFTHLSEIASETVKMPPSRNLLSPRRREGHEGVGPSAWSVVAFQLPTGMDVDACIQHTGGETPTCSGDSHPSLPRPKISFPQDAEVLLFGPLAPSDTVANSSSAALKHFFGEDDLGNRTMALFKAAL